MSEVGSLLGRRTVNLSPNGNPVTDEEVAIPAPEFTIASRGAACTMKIGGVDAAELDAVPGTYGLERQRRQEGASELGFVYFTADEDAPQDAKIELLLNNGLFARIVGDALGGIHPPTGSKELRSGQHTTSSASAELVEQLTPARDDPFQFARVIVTVRDAAAVPGTDLERIRLRWLDSATQKIFVEDFASGAGDQATTGEVPVKARSLDVLIDDKSGSKTWNYSVVGIYS